MEHTTPPQPTRTTRWWSRGWLWNVALLAAITALLITFYGPVLSQPDYHVFSSSGDGAKNYFTYLYHVLNDEHAFTSDGVNYPFGELVFFTDGHPALSWLLRFLPFAGPHAVGILNLLLLFGIAGYGLLISAILRHFGLSPWAAAAGAFGATILQPQLFRMEGHLALAHCYVLPLAWYTHLRSIGSPRRWRWTIGTGLVLLYAFCTHAYLGLMLALFLSASWGLRWLRRQGFSRIDVAHALTQAILPLVFFVGTVKLLDHHVDRPQAPLTDADLLASVSGLCVPHHPSPLKPLTDLWSSQEPSWEAWCYLGVATMLVLLMATLVQLFQWSGRTRKAIPSKRDDLTLYLGASFIVLFFAFGLHRPLERFVPMLQQFRGLGRLAWVFYMVASVFALTRLYQWTQRLHGRWRYGAVPLFLLAPALNVVEGRSYFITSRQSVSDVWTPFIRDWAKDDMRAVIDAVETHHPVALLPMPFWHAGSEVFKRGNCGSAFRSVFPVSLFTRTPVLAGLTSRTSIPETVADFSLLAPMAYPKTIAKDLPASGDILVVRGTEDLDDDEEDLIARCTPLLKNDLAQLYTISIADLVRSNGPALLAQHKARRDSLPWWGEQRVEWPVLNSSVDSNNVLCGSGIENEVERRWDQFLALIEKPPGALDTAHSYELSLEFRTIDPAGVNLPLIWEHDTPGEKDGLWEPMENIRAMPMIIGDRVFARMRIRPRDPKHHNLLFIPGDRKRRVRYAISHVLLRRDDVHVWREEPAPGGTLILRDNVPLNPEVLQGTTVVK